MDLEPNEKDVSSSEEDSENVETRRARTLIFLVALGFLIVGVMNVAAYWLKCRHDHLDVSIGRCLYLSIPLVIGLVILILSSSLARAIDEYLDE